MKGYDLIEALGQLKDAYVEEAAYMEETAGGSGRRKFPLKTAVACLLLLVLPSATVLAADCFSTLKGDELAFERVEYLGDGVVSIRVRNDSDKTLKLQEDVKLCIFYANREIPQTEGGKVKMEGNVVAPHDTSEVRVDLSGAYDMKVADMPLEHDWYYLELTNDHFLFGQNWQCPVDFQKAVEETVVYRAPREEHRQEYEELEMERFVCGDWAAPTARIAISGVYGTRENGSFSDHINIAGEKGDEVYAVAEGTVLETGFTARDGNYIILSIGNDTSVKYGHLKDILVSENQAVERGALIGTIGQSGQASGPNLAFTLYENGEPVNPLKEEALE